jgi:hypothetical protein
MFNHLIVLHDISDIRDEYFLYEYEEKIELSLIILNIEQLHNKIQKEIGIKILTVFIEF